MQRATNAVNLLADLQRLGLVEPLGDTLETALAADVTFYAPNGTVLDGSVLPDQPPPTMSERYALATGPVVRRTPVFQVIVPLADGAYAIYQPRPRPKGSVSHWSVVIAGVLFFVLLSSLVFGQYLARPMERLTAAARAFGSGQLDARVGPMARTAEFAELATSFDEMADRIADLVRSQKELLANVSHELRTPLARIRLALDLADEGDPAAARESLRDIAGDLEELERLVADVLTTARLDLAMGRAGETTPLRCERVEVPVLLERAIGRVRAAHPQREFRIELEETVGSAIHADPALFRRALDNLLDNAVRHSEADRPIVLGARGDETGWAISVVDRGVGIPPEDLAQLFTPFFRSDRSRTRSTGGLGLGLVLARRIVVAHGGTLELESRVGEGTTAWIHLPRQTLADARAA